MTCIIPGTSPHRQQGAFSIMTAFTLLVLLMFLVLVLDSGRLYMEQRKLQKVADTAALGALLLLPDGNCSTDRTLTEKNARDNADANGFTATGKRGLTLQCADIVQSEGLRVATPNDTSGRAVEITVSHKVPSSLILQVGSVFNSGVSEEITLQATAVAARDEPVAVFTVEAQLLNLDEDGLLAKLLDGVGLNPETIKLLTSDGLANVDITPSGLLKALGVDANVDLKALTPEGLVDSLGIGANLFTLPQILDASIKLIAESAVDVGVDLVEAVKLPATLEDLKLNLFSTYDEYGEKTPGIISVDTDGPLGAALDARINLGEILRTAILIGAQGRGISIGASSEEDSLGLLGLIKVQAGIVEPPSIGIGPVGTTAHNAQIRLLIDTDTSDTLLVGGLLDALGTRIRLPVIIEITNATAELTKLTCDGPNPEAEIETTGSIADICIGDMPESTMWSTRSSCLGSVEDATLATALGISLVRGSIALPVLKNPTDDLLSFDLTNLPSTELGKSNELPAGTLVKDIVDELLELTLVSHNIPDSITAEMAKNIATSYTSEIQPENGGKYTVSQLDKIKGKLKNDGFNWDNPALPLCIPFLACIDLGKKPMPDNWRDTVADNVCSGKNYTTDCVENSLVESLQSKSSSASLDVCIFGLCLSKVTNPLLQGVLILIIEPLKDLLDFVGQHILTPILDDLLGLKIGQSKVTVHDASCGAPRLVR